mmetsp:Transcript_132441/g.313985  ORF Transcript_132441/g.313985 Transcript_132441/m.313985 type:complete len:126 (-) Transcript_132441:275-652(-)
MRMFNVIFNTTSKNFFLTFTFSFQSSFELLHKDFVLMKQFGTFIFFKILLFFNQIAVNSFLSFNFLVDIQFVLFIFKHFSHFFFFFSHFFFQFSKFSIHLSFHFSLLSFNFLQVFFFLLVDERCE